MAGRPSLEEDQSRVGLCFEILHGHERGVIGPDIRKFVDLPHDGGARQVEVALGHPNGVVPKLSGAIRNPLFQTRVWKLAEGYEPGMLS